MKKKYQVVILIEIFTIFIMISWSVMIFQMKFRTIATEWKFMWRNQKDFSFSLVFETFLFTISHW